MLYNIIYALGIILMLTGLFFLFYVLISKSLCLGEKHNYYTVIAGYEEKKNLPDEIYCAFTQMNLFNLGSPPPLIVIDYNLSEETRLRCSLMNEAFGKIVFCKENELTEIIGNNLYSND